MEYFDKKKKFIIKILGGIVLITVFILIIQKIKVGVEIEKIKVFVNSFGIFAPLVYILLVSSTIILSPLPNSPFCLAGFFIFGFWRTVIYVMIGNMLAATINFFIARKFGRLAVKKFIGNNGIKKVDKFTEIFGKQVLLILRGFGLWFDYVSYAAGLTLIRFRTYFLITLFNLPAIFISLYIFYKALNFYGPIVFILVGYAIAFITSLLGVFYYKYKIKRKRPIL